MTARTLSNRMLALSIVLLLVSLLAVVLLAKKFSLVVDVATALIGAPPAFAGVLVALLILLPESVAAIAAARKNDLQKSINLALGSSLATIGLTIPAVAVAAYALDKQLVLGLDAQEMVLLAADVRPEHADLRHRPHQHPVRAGPSGGVCGIRVPGVRAVTFLMARTPTAIALILVVLPRQAHAATLDGAAMKWPFALPFAGLLLSIALGPLLFPKLWHAHYGKIAAAWSVATLASIASFAGGQMMFSALVHAMLRGISELHRAAVRALHCRRRHSRQRRHQGHTLE